MKIVLFVLTLLGVSNMAQMAGGWSSKPVDDEQVVTMAAFAVPLVQENIQHSAFFKLNAIESAEGQVVSGMNYRIKMLLEETTSDAAAQCGDGSECVAASPSKKVRCTVVVYDQPWTKTRKITESSCELIE